MTDKQREILTVQLAAIDRRRAELEAVLTTLPPDTQHGSESEADHQRHELEAELPELWQWRAEITEQLNPPRIRRSA